MAEVVEAARLLAAVEAQALFGGCYLAPNSEEEVAAVVLAGFQVAAVDLEAAEAAVSEDLAAEVLAAGDRVDPGNFTLDLTS